MHIAVVYAEFDAEDFKLLNCGFAKFALPDLNPITTIESRSLSRAKPSGS